MTFPWLGVKVLGRECRDATWLLCLLSPCSWTVRHLSLSLWESLPSPSPAKIVFPEHHMQEEPKSQDPKPELIAALTSKTTLHAPASGT